MDLWLLSCGYWIMWPLLVGFIIVMWYYGLIDKSMCYKLLNKVINFPLNKRRYGKRALENEVSFPNIE